MKRELCLRKLGLVALWWSLGCTGCLTEMSESPSSSPHSPPAAMRLMPGDDVEISVFGATDLNTVQKVRPDGKITIKLFGDIQAAGRLPMELQEDLIKLYETQLQIKTISVVVRSSAAIYVTGAVVRPGKVDYLRPMTVLEAIMECGGFDMKAGARRGKVRVIRREGSQVSSYVVDMEEILTKGETDPFFLKPFDSVYVPGAW